MKKLISFVFAALAALFMAVSVGVISADELPFNDLVTEISVVDDTNEIIEKTITVVLLPLKLAGTTL